VIAVWLLGCTGDTVLDTADTATSTDTGCWTGIRGLLYGDDRNSPSPEPGGKVFALSATGDELETVALDDGSWRLPLWEHTWILSAENAYGDCFSDEQPTIDLVSCQPQDVDLYTDLCFG